MLRRYMMLVATVALLASAGTSMAASSENEAAPPATQVQAPVLPPPARDALANIRMEHILAVAAGAVAGDVLLEGLLNLPGGVNLVVGGIVGYYVYVNYLEPQVGPTGRRISVAADEAKLYLINAGEAVLRASDRFLGQPASQP